MISSRDNSVDIFSLPAVSLNRSMSIIKGNKTDTLSFVVIILLTDDVPKDTQPNSKSQQTNKQTNKELGILVF